jgi:thymidylate synthase
MNTLDKQYLNLLEDILENGVEKNTRNGKTLSVFGRQIRHKMLEGFPIITTKKIPFKVIVTELLWFLNGRSDLRFLLENNCNIWTGDAWKNYLSNFKDDVYGSQAERLVNCSSQEEFINKIKTDDEFAEKWGSLGKIYGVQWRGWEMDDDYLGDGHKMYFDQIAEVIDKLKTNPDDRGIIVSAWNVSDLNKMILRPCHNFFQFYTRELTFEERCEFAINKGWMSPYGALDFPETHYALNTSNTPKRAISLMYNARSQDVPLGTPFNISSYGLLLEIIARIVNMVPDELIVNMGDCHIYSNQIDGVKEQLGRELSFEERRDLMVKYTQDNNLLPIPYTIPFGEESKKKYLEVCNKYNIPKRTIEPYSLPTLKHMKTDEFYKSLGEDLSLLSHLTVNDFVLENYQSHPKIYFPLSN